MDGNARRPRERRCGFCTGSSFYGPGGGPWRGEKWIGGIWQREEGGRGMGNIWYNGIREKKDYYCCYDQ